MDDFITALFILFNLLGLSIPQQSPGTCQDNGVCSALWETNGDVTIGIVANIHTGSEDNNGYKPCSVFQPQDVELVEASIWLFDRIYQADYIPGIRLGMKVYDACDRSDIAATSAVSMLPYLRYANSTTLKKVDGILGIVTSSQAKQLVDTLETTNVPLVSPTATAPSLAHENTRFFRTIPSDELQMKVLYNFIKSLQIKYFVIVHSSDEFGLQGLKELKRHVNNDGGQVCIADSIAMRSLGEAILIVDKLVSLQQNLNQKNLPVLFIGQYIDAKGLVVAANSYKTAHRLIWVFPDAVGVDASLFDGYEKVGWNAFSVSPYYNAIDEFKTYWTGKLHNSLNSGGLTSRYPPYYEEYIETLLGCSITSGSCNGKTLQDFNNAYSQSSYINTALDSAFAFAKAIKALHTAECGSINGICPQFEQTLKSTTGTQFIYILRSVSANYTGADNFAFLPSSFMDSSGFKFEANGNLKIAENQNIYLIHNVKCRDDCQFQIVGTATRDAIDLDYDAITLYLDHNSDVTTLGSELPSIYCAKNCQVCEDKFKPGIHHAGIWGENLIVAFVPVHKSGSTAFGCGGMRDRQTIEDVEALLFGIETFNNNSGPWNATPILSGRLGIIVFDSCQNSLLATNVLSQWLSGSLKIDDGQGRFYDPSTCIGIIGGLYSKTNLQIIPVSRKEFLVQVGYASSSLELPINSPEFLRTIPADDIQAQAMVDLVKKLGFSAFSVIYRDDSYGSNGYEQLVTKADEAKLCVNKAIPIPQNVNEQQLSDVFAALQDAIETRVVIVFSNADEGKVILRTANKKTIKKKFIWIGSEAWGKRENLIYDSGNEALGLTVIDFPQSNNLNYTRYMTSLKPNKNMRNMFFKEWWESKFQCTLPTASIPNPPNKCSDSLSIPPPTDVQTAILALKAVWTMALGLSAAFEKMCSRDITACASKIRNENSRNIISEEIRNTKLLKDGKEFNVYSSRGDGRLTEELWNVQKVNNQKKFVKVADYSDGGLVLPNPPNFKYYDINGEEIVQPQSTCLQCNCIYRYPDDPLIQLNNNMSLNGQVYIVAFLPFHQSLKLKTIDSETVLLAEGLKQMVMNANAKTFGKDVVGLLVYDSYSDKDIAALQTTLVMHAGRYLRLKHYSTDANDLLCVLSYGTGIDAKYIGSTLDNDIIHLNVGQTISSPSLSQEYFYNLGFTLEQELNAMLAVLQHFEWTGVTLVYADSEESIHAKDAFTNLAKQQGICPIKVLSVTSFAARLKYNDIQSRIIILFINGKDADYILDTAGSMLGNYVFISWSKFARSLSEIASNYFHIAYRTAFNNTLMMSIEPESIDPTNADVIQSLKSQVYDQISNPWMQENFDFAKAVDNVQDGISQIGLAVKSFVSAFQTLMLAECGRNEICKDLLDKPDWKTQRLALFLERDSDFFNAVRSNKKFTIQTYQLNSYNEGFTNSQIGTFDPGSVSVSITDGILNSFYKAVKSSCEGNICDSCNIGSTSCPFPGWAVALIIIILFLVAVIIGLIVYIVRLNRTPTVDKRGTDFHVSNVPELPYPMSDFEDIYLEPDQMDKAEYYVAHTQKNGDLQKGNYQYDYAQNAGDSQNGRTQNPPTSSELITQKMNIKKYNITDRASDSSDSDKDAEEAPGNLPQDRLRDECHTNSPMNAIWLYEAGIGSPISSDDTSFNYPSKETTNPAHEIRTKAENPYRMSFNFGKIHPYQNDSVATNQDAHNHNDKLYKTNGPKYQTDGFTDNDYEHLPSTRRSFMTKFGDRSENKEDEEDYDGEGEDSASEDEADSISIHNNNNYLEVLETLTDTVDGYDKDPDLTSDCRSNTMNYTDNDDANNPYSMSLSFEDIDSSRPNAHKPAILLENEGSISGNSVDV